MLKIFTYKLCFFIPFFVLQSLFFSYASHAEKVTIFIRDDVYYDYEKFVEGRDILSIKNFSGKTIRRDVVDMIIAQQALKIGGFEHTFEYVPGKLNFRNTKLLEEGKLLISFDSYWLSDAEKLAHEVYISLPLINKGEYIAGIYTNPKNKAVLAIKSLEDLSQFTAVSTPRWATDWKTLQALPLKDLIREDEWLSQARMVNLGWIDFMLMAFHSTADKSFTMDKIHLVPVKDIGIELKDSRHYVISKKHPLGAEATKAIDIGLKVLRKEKRISRAYQQAGFFVDKNIIHILNK
ncbi:hypothetical protein Q4493_15030 [Colwellia sp. 1_MG-2023]|uniref:hypothetical protein n=1 Tax=Colwellia sp. 1_MG-2023 TaxID=3062649 RepID=UPI0026E1B2FA|nr:hypothetical protein [Colwellia sp. 1_MG-2023]MDO6447083.1 hypothetical protein [Colwellia sp. 1_MG-2023]